MRRLAAVAAFLLLALCAGAVHAQSMATSTTPAAAVEGAGVKLGDRLVLHVGIGAELRYDSNVFYESSNTTQALILRLTPQFTLATRNSQRDGGPGGHTVDFRIGAGLDYREFLVANTFRPPRQFNIIAGTSLTILPTGPFTTEIFDNYIRSTQPPYQKQTFNYDRDINELGARFRIKPGGGRLELQVGYTFGIDLWETKAQQPYDNFYHHLMLRVLYKFLPKTSVYIQGDDVIYQYRNTDETADLNRPNGFPLRVIAGLNGLLTTKLTFDIYGGYGNGFYTDSSKCTNQNNMTVKCPSPSTGLAGLTLTWKPFALSAFAFAYRHDFENTLVGVYADYDNIALSWTQQIWRFAAFLRVAYQNTRYLGIQAESGVVNEVGTPTSTRTDNEFALNARVDYYTYKNWLALSLGYDFNILRSNSNLLTNPTAAALIPVNFTKHEVYLGLSLFY